MILINLKMIIIFYEHREGKPSLTARGEATDNLKLNVLAV